MASDSRRVEIVVGFKDKISGAFKSVAGDISSTAGKIKSKVNSALKGFKSGGIDDSKFNKDLKRLRSSAIATARSIGNSLQTGIERASLAGAGFVATGVKGFLEMDSALTNISNKTGKYGQDFEGIKDNIKSLSFKGYGQDIQEIGDRTALLNQVTGKTGKELEELTKNSLLFTETFKDSTPEEYLGALNGMTRNLGGTWKENQALLMRFRQGNADLKQDLLDTANEYAFSFKEAGFSGVGMLELLNKAAKEGAFNLDFVGDSIKEFGIRLGDGDKNLDQFIRNVKVATGDKTTNFGEMFAQGGEQANEAFKKLVIGAMSIKDPILRSQTLVGLFGTKGEDMAQKIIGLYGTIDNSQKHANEVIQESIKITEKAGNAFENAASTKFTGLSREFQQIIADSFLSKENVTKFFDYIKNNKEGIINGIKGIGQAIIGIGKVLQTLAPYVTNLVTSLGNFAKEHPNILAIGSALILLINPITSLLRFFINLGPIIKGVWAIMMANPISALIVLLGGFAIWAIKNWDDIKYSFIGLWESVKEPVQSFIDNTIYGFQGLWESIKAGAQQVLDYLKPIIDIGNTIMGWMTGGLFGGDSLGKTLQNKVQTGNLGYLSKNTGTSVQDILGRKTASQGGNVGGTNITIQGNVYGGDKGLVELKTKIDNANLNLTNA